MTEPLFAEHLEGKLQEHRGPGHGTYWQRLQRLCSDHNYCSSQPEWYRRIKFERVRELRQLDKDEPSLTYFLFAALNLSTNDFQDRERLLTLLKQAYCDLVASELVDHLVRSRWGGLSFECPASPAPRIVTAVRSERDHHPVEYVREFASKNHRVGFEGRTKYDVFVGDERSLLDDGGKNDGWGLGVEVKFTADISCDTTYSTHRNQIIRNIEVGNSHFKNFCFLLLSPQQYELHRSRFYAYKMNEYKGCGGTEALERDSLTKPGVGEAEAWKRRLGWLSIEEVVKAIYPDGSIVNWHGDAKAFSMFLQARNLWPSW